MGKKEKVMPKGSKVKACNMANERKDNECFNFTVKG
jgi:hypothetical protein